MSTNKSKNHYNHIISYDIPFKDLYTNVMQNTGLHKIVLNTGIGKNAVVDRKQMVPARLALEIISGQTPLITRAKKSIDKFKLRENMPIGCKVTLRGNNLYLFLDKLVNWVLPKPALEELTDLYRSKSFAAEKTPRPKDFNLQDSLYKKGSTKTKTETKRINYESFKFSPLSRRGSTGISRRGGIISAKSKKSREFGIRDYLAFRQVEQHYDKFDKSYGLNIIFVLQESFTHVSETNQQAWNKGTSIYLLTGFQVPLV